MRKLIPYLIGTCLALWFGGLIALFMFVQYLFKTDYDMAKRVAPMMLFIFERYQLMLAAILLVSMIVWRIYGCSKPKKMLMACLLGAACFAIAQFAVISPKINELRINGQTGDPEFKKLHGYSMMIYVGTTVFAMLANGAFITTLTTTPTFSGKLCESAPV